MDYCSHHQVVDADETNYPAVKVAGFNISRQDDANVWIAREGGEDDGEGGVFSNEVFGAAIAKFYDENF